MPTSTPTSTQTRPALPETYRSPAPVPARAGRIPSLDGLRALSIAVVVLGHLNGTTGFLRSLGPWLWNDYVDVAHLGVVVFFVISGYLITGLLAREMARTSRVALARFYLRRMARLAPAMLVYVAVIGALTLGGMLAVPGGRFVAALTYTMNYYARTPGATPNAGWPLGHLWSLAVEEQFYLLWPAVVVVAGLRRAAVVAVAVMLVVPVLRVATFMHDQSTLPAIGVTFQTAADALAAGCLLALVGDALWGHVWYRRLVTSRWLIAVVFAVGVACNVRWRLGLFAGRSLVILAAALLIDRCVRRPDGQLGRVLNTRALVLVGQMSYSLYLWQQLFLNRYSDAGYAVFPLNLVLTCVAAWASYRLVELPALRWRERAGGRR